LITGETDRQGNSRANHSPSLASRRAAFYRHQLFRHTRIADGKRDIRHERGAFTGAAERRIGCFELADGGTLLLDEIGEMPAPTQAKLSAFWKTTSTPARQQGGTPVDVRVLAATNKEPEQAVAKGELRQDLYFSFECVPYSPAALRERKEDIPLLVEHILRDINAKHARHIRA